MGNSWDSNYLNVTGDNIIGFNQAIPPVILANKSANDILAATCSTIYIWLISAKEEQRRLNIERAAEDAGATTTQDKLPLKTRMNANSMYIDSLQLALSQKGCKEIALQQAIPPVTPTMPPIQNGDYSNSGVVSVPSLPLNEHGKPSSGISTDGKILNGHGKPIGNGWGFHGIATDIANAIGDFLNLKSNDDQAEAITNSTNAQEMSTQMPVIKPKRKKTFLKWLFTGMKK